MSDNTTLPTGAGGDIVRTIDRGTVATGPLKTQVVQVDFGGEGASQNTPEALVTSQNQLPVQDPNNQLIARAAALQLALSLVAAQNNPGFYPAENSIGFLLGVQ